MKDLSHILEDFELVPLYERKAVIGKELCVVEPAPDFPTPVNYKTVEKYALKLSLGVEFFASSATLQSRIEVAKRRLHFLLFDEIIKDLEEIEWLISNHDNKEASIKTEMLIKRLKGKYA